MLNSQEYRARDAVGLAELVRSGEVTAREVLEAAIAEIERLDPALNAVVMRNYEKARDDAEAVDRKAPLAGVPFPAKDVNVHVSGFPTTYACRFFAGAPVETADSLLVSRWRAAGLIIPARTNTPEFATDFGCEPELYGPTANPWDRTRTPGGSSGGAAAAVASGMVPMAHATDSGGSIRVPAGCCGVFGFKPSSGLVAIGAEFGPLVGGLNCDHAVTWTVRDSAALLDATAGPEIGAPTPFATPSGAFLAALDRPVGGLRIGVATASPGGRAPAVEIAGKIEATAGLLANLGHAVRPWTLADSRTMPVTLRRYSGQASSPRWSPTAPRRSAARLGTESWDRWSPGAWPRRPGWTRFKCRRRAGRCGTGRSGWPMRWPTSTCC